MARTIHYRITLDVSINESELALLRVIDRHASRSGAEVPVEITARGFSAELDLSLATIRRSCRALKRSGLILIYDKRREDGGRGANAYEVTRLGREVLACEGDMRPRRISSRG